MALNMKYIKYLVLAAAALCCGGWNSARADQGMPESQSMTVEKDGEEYVVETLHFYNPTQEDLVLCMLDDGKLDFFRHIDYHGSQESMKQIMFRFFHKRSSGWDFTLAEYISDLNPVDWNENKTFFSKEDLPWFIKRIKPGNSFVINSISKQGTELERRWLLLPLSEVHSFIIANSYLNEKVVFPRDTLLLHDGNAVTEKPTL